MSCTRGCSATCGCCEGVEPVTPVAIDNPPALDALAYRAGTHGRFMETMLAQLSRHALEDGTRPLRALRTRAPDDPAIAFLDAWATVADILTFYQERIANEGFLRTATERRSVLELGRLLGYRMRPGVAATTYLAYTLEEGARITLEAGNRVQSVPDPGELPQTFETVEAAEARGEWNALEVRTTRPVDPAGLAAMTGDDVRSLYFTGITTGLDPNDPVLLDFGPVQGLFRVVEVEADSEAGRTRVAIQPWQQGSSGIGRPPEPVDGDPEDDDTPAVLLERVDALLSAAAVPRRTVTVMRVVQQLERLRTNLVLGVSGDELDDLVGGDVLPAIRAARAVSRRPVAADPWLDRVEAELAGAVARADRSLAVAVPAAATAKPIGGALNAIAKPASIPPGSPAELRPALETTFGATSDAVPGLLGVMRPELGGRLYEAWRNLESTPPSTLRAYALRVRAAPFGHAAPLEPVKDRDGVVTGHREWRLNRPAAETAPEAFEIQLFVPTVPNDSPPAVVTGTVSIADASDDVDIPLEDLLDGPVTRSLPNTGERLTVELALPSDSPPANGSLRLRLRERGASFVTEIGSIASGPESAGPGLRWASEGSDPTSLRFTVDEESGPVPGFRGAAGVVAWRVQIEGELHFVGRAPTEDPFVVSLDTTYPEIVPESWVAIERPVAAGSPSIPGLIISAALPVREASRADYGITGRSTQIGLDEPWLELGRGGDSFAVIRGSTVFAHSELLEVAEQPIEPVAEPVCGHEIPLERLYDGLEPGRWLIVEGERTDVASGAEEDATPIAGVRAVELTMLAAVRQEVDPAEPGARTRSTIVLAEPLAYCYRRDTLVIRANVVKATHGETREEILGSGQGDVPNQAFELRSKPLTHLSAPTPTGVDSTLDVYVGGVRWHEAESPVGLTPTDRRWVASADDEDTTTVTFGNGVEGARLPTGQENVAAIYRFGIGRTGNVGPGRLTLLISRPNGVMGVTNPQQASGGADREDRDQARRNIPLTVTALDRIVSVQDHADFARTFAGIAKASAVRLPGGVHVTIAGEDDVPILETSDLFRNLRRALARYGEPFQPFQVDVRRLRLMVVVANVAVHPDHRWEVVQPAVRRALEDAFAFNRRDLGQDVARSEVLSVIQAVPGVVYVDLDILDTVDRAQVEEELTTPTPGGIAAGLALNERLRADLAHVGTPPDVEPAELIVVSPDAPQTLTLLEVRP